jgi:hypothetical protein
MTYLLGRDNMKTSILRQISDKIVDKGKWAMRIIRIELITLRLKGEYSTN